MALLTRLINVQIYCCSLSNSITHHKWFLSTLFPGLKFISKAPKPTSVKKKSSLRVILSVVSFLYEHSSCIVKLFNLFFVSIAESEANEESCNAKIFLLYTQFRGETVTDKMLLKERKKVPLKPQCHKNRDRFCSPNRIHWQSFHSMKLRWGLGVWHLLWRLYFRSSIINS